MRRRARPSVRHRPDRFPQRPEPALQDAGVRERLLLAGGVFLVALLVRLIHLWQIRDAPFFELYLGDAEGYDAWARRIADGDWIGREVFYQAPLYPYFLGSLYRVLGDGIGLVKAVQAVLGAASCALLAQAAWLLAGRSAALAAGAMLAVYPPAVFFDTVLQKSVLDVLLLCALLWVVARLVGRPAPVAVWGIGGALLGLLTLTRENALVLAAAVVAWAAVDRARTWSVRRTAIGVFALGLAIVLLPVGLRNLAVSGEFHLTTSQLGPNLFIGNNPRADGIYKSLRPARGSSRYEQPDARAIAEAGAGRSLSPGEVSRYFVDRVIDFAVSRPSQWLTLLARKWMLAWNAVEIADTEDQYAYAERSSVLEVLGRLWHFGVLAPLAVLGVWVTRRDRRLVVFRLMTGVYLATLVVFYVFARYRLPLAPMLMLFGAILVPALRPWWREATVRARGAAAGLLLGVALMANWPLLQVADMRAVTHYNVATRLDRLGHPHEAESALQLALRHKADFPEALNRLGMLRGSRGDLDGARAAFERALTVKPDFAPGLNSLGELELAASNLREAERLFTRATELDPWDARAWNNLGIVRSRMGQDRDALLLYERAARLDPELLHARTNLGQALLDQGRTDDAARELERASELDPESAIVRHQLGRLSLARGDAETAERSFREALSRDSALTGAYHDLAGLFARRGNREEAETVLREAIRAGAAQADTYNNLGIVLASQERVAESIAAFEEAVGRAPASAPMRNNLGLALLTDDRVPEAARQLEEAVRLDPGHAQAHQHLGVAYARLGRRPEAVERLERALALDPNLSPARETLRRLRGG